MARISVAVLRRVIETRQNTMLASNHYESEGASTVIDPQMGKTLARKLGPQYGFNI